MYYTTSSFPPVGRITLACDGENLTGLWIEGQKYHGTTDTMIKQDDLPIFHSVRDWLVRYFSGQNPDLTELPLAPMGSAFRQEVWRVLYEIPYGTVITYRDIAHKIALRRNLPSMSSQAVGGAVGHNPISIIIPCHRVVGTNGSLTGYAGGLEAKVRLLALEGVDLSGLFMPKTK